jgi:hypothetical protein
MFGEPSSKEKLSVSMFRAVQCALDIQSNLRQYDAAGVKLTLHIGIGAGDLTELLVGGVNSNWEWLVSGHCLSQLDSTVEASKEGEVVVSDSAYKLIKGKCKSQARGKDWLITEVDQEVKVTPYPELDIRTEIESAIRCHVHKGVLDRIDSGHSQFLGELRRVTCLFVNLKKLSLEPSASHDDQHKKETEQSSELLEKINQEFEESQQQIKSSKKRAQVDLLQVHKALFTMQSILFHYEGVVRQFLVDDKGTVFIGVFGVPPYSHEDDCVRGIQAALEISSSLDQMQMDNSIGVT